MKRSELALGIGLGALLAVCCGSPLLLALALPVLALLTGQALLVTVGAAVLALLAVGIVAWQRRLRLHRSLPRRSPEHPCACSPQGAADPAAQRS